MDFQPLRRLHLPREIDRARLRIICVDREDQIDLWMRHARCLDHVFDRSLLRERPPHGAPNPQIAIQEEVQVTVKREFDFKHSDETVCELIALPDKSLLVSSSALGRMRYSS